MISEHNSWKIKVISLLAAWAVVIWHSYCGASICQWFIPLFSYWSVPWFFLCTGFFFFNSWTPDAIGKKFLGKCKTLLVPYIIWCIVGLVINWFFCADKIRGFADVLALRHDSIWPCYNRALWYLRCVIVFAVIGFPLRFIVDKGLKTWSKYSVVMFSCIFALLIFVLHKYVFRIYGPGSSLFYFLSGVVLRAISDVRDISGLIDRKINHRYTFLVPFLCWMIAMCAWFSLGYRFSVMGGNILNNVSTCFLLVALWFGADYVSPLLTRLRSQELLASGGICAFVYFAHSPLLKMFIDYMAPRLNGQLAKNLFFVLLCLCYTPICIVIGLAIRRCYHRLWYILTGGR